MNEQVIARTQLAELVQNHGIKLRVLARHNNVGIPYFELYRFYRGEKAGLDPKSLERIEKFYNAVKVAGSL